MSNKPNHVEIWTSKLGGKFPKDEIERNHNKYINLLTKLRNMPANSKCADCGNGGTVWSSVNLGVFTCMRCGSFHRALGTHVSKPKGCTGTYLWGPDEISRMQEIGNERAEEIYGGTAHRPRSGAPDSEWLEYIRNKYERKKWAKKDIAPNASTSSQQRQQASETREDLMDEWVKSLREKDERKKRSEMDNIVTSTKRRSEQAREARVAVPSRTMLTMPTADLLGLDDSIAAEPEEKDFFAEFGL